MAGETSPRLGSDLPTPGILDRFHLVKASKGGYQSINWLKGGRAGRVEVPCF